MKWLWILLENLWEVTAKELVVFVAVFGVAGLIVGLIADGVRYGIVGCAASAVLGFAIWYVKQELFG